MRQAGRYLPEYRALRERHGFLELCRTPAAAAEVTLQPVRRFAVDAAILFADILLIVEPLDVGLEFARGEGPVIHRPVRAEADVARLKAIDVESSVGTVFETVRLVRRELRPSIALIGFAGAPFTVASYVVEGGASRGTLWLVEGRLAHAAEQFLAHTPEARPQLQDITAVLNLHLIGPSLNAIGARQRVDRLLELLLAQPTPARRGTRRIQHGRTGRSLHCRWGRLFG